MEHRSYLNILQGRDGHCDEGFQTGATRGRKGFEIKAQGESVIVVLLDVFSPTVKGNKRQTAFISLVKPKGTWEIAEKALSWGNHDLSYLLRDSSGRCEPMHETIPELEGRVCLVDCGPLRPRKFHRRTPRAPYSWVETQTIGDPPNPISLEGLKQLITEKKKKKNEILIRDITEARDTPLTQGRQVLNIVFVNNNIEEVKQMVFAGTGPA